MGYYIKRGVLTVLLCLGAATVQAQKTIHFGDLGVGYEEDGYLIRLAYNRLYGHHLFTLGGQMHIETHDTGRGLDQDLEALIYLLNLEYHYEILNLNERDFVIYLGGGGLIGYEYLDQIPLSQGRTLTQESTLIYGGQLGITLDKYLMTVSNDNGIAVFLNLRQNYIAESVLGNTQFNATLGLRYLF